MTKIADFISGIDGLNKRRIWQRYLEAVPAADVKSWNTLLKALPDNAWAILKADTLRQIDQHHPSSGWAQAQQRFNEARAYLYLQSIGCEDIAFVTAKAAKSSPKRAPDLIAQCHGESIACEVKTLHISRTSPYAARKLQTRLQDAQAQLATASAQSHLIYLVLTGDDLLLRNQVTIFIGECQLVLDYDGKVEAFT